VPDKPVPDKESHPFNLIGHFRSEMYRQYRALLNASTWLPMDQLEPNRLYWVYARNAYQGIWSPQDRGFCILREKFGSRYLFTEYHWDTGKPFGTVKPFGLVDGEGPFDLQDPDGTFARLDLLDRLHDEPEKIGLVTMALDTLLGKICP